MGLVSNQIIIIPLGASCTFDPPYNRMEPLFAIHETPSKWLCVQNVSAGAGYYSAFWGPAPYVFGPAPLEYYFVYRVK